MNWWVSGRLSVGRWSVNLTKPRKHNPRHIKQELLVSIMEIVNEEDYSGLNVDVKIRRTSQIIKS